MPQAFNTVILGGGPGGAAAAKFLAKAGKTVALVSDDLGGECLNYGCIPTKTLLWTAELLEKIAQGETFGIDGLKTAQANWATMKKRKTDVVSKLKKALSFTLQKSGVSLFEGRGEFDGTHDTHDTHEVRINKEVISGEFIILATGSEPKFPPGFSQSDSVHTSRTILDILEIPKTLLIIGGGAIGCEFASLFSILGTKVTMAEASEQLLPNEDPDISTELERVFVRRGIAVLKNTRLNPGQAKNYEKVLIAIGRASVVPNFNPGPHIRVIGDAASRFFLAYTAEREGENAAREILGQPIIPIREETVPNTIFSIPEVASVGLTEPEAKSAGISIRIGKALFSANSKALILGNRDGLAKVIAAADSGKLLGVHLIGERATELIAEASLALSCGITLPQLLENFHGHPVLGEILKSAYENAYHR